jgi:adenine-specific DNA methylase
MLKRLIEVALPLKEVSEQSAREKSIRHGHISTLHIWWARRPLAACRAVIFASLIPDPDDLECPESFRTLVNDLLNHSEFKPRKADGSPANDTARNRCLEYIKHLVKWENSNNQHYLEPARKLIAVAHKFLHPHAEGDAPKLLDPFTGGGAIPLEALRLGCEAHALDINPVAHLIQLCTLVYPQKYGQPNSRPVPDYIKRLIAYNKARRRAKGQESADLFSKDDAVGSPKDLIPAVDITEADYLDNPLSADVKYWANWVLTQASSDLASLYQTDGGDGQVVAYVWAKTVVCPNPKCRTTLPLMSQFRLSKGDQSARLEPHSQGAGSQAKFSIRFDDTHSPDDEDESGTIQRGSAICPSCGETCPNRYLQEQGKAGKIGHQLVAKVISRPSGGRDYRLCTKLDEGKYASASEALRKLTATNQALAPNEPAAKHGQRSCSNLIYGYDVWRKFFNDRQLFMLLTLARHIKNAESQMCAAGASKDFATAVCSYLMVLLGREADYNSVFCRWVTGGFIGATFGGEAKIPMVWDYAEANPFSGETGSFESNLDWIVRVIDKLSPSSSRSGIVRQGDAARLPWPEGCFDSIISDPPYYDSANYSELSDFFYVWFKRCSPSEHESLLRPPLTPKKPEIVQNRHRHGITEEEAKKLYERMMTGAFQEMRRVTKAGSIVAIVFAHKTTAAWETLVGSLLSSGLIVSASWPLRTERPGRMKAQGAAALASSIFIICRNRTKEAVDGLWDDVRRELRQVGSERLDFFWSQGIRGADFFISAIGPALSVFGKYERVKKLSSDEVTVGQFLDEVRGLVTAYALNKIMKTTHTATIDTESQFYVIWKWSYGEAKVPGDEAYKLAQALGTNTETMWDRTGVLEKSGENVQAMSVAKRMKVKNLGEPNSDSTPASLIDVLHRLCAFRDKNDTEGMTEFLGRSGQGRNPNLWLVAQAVSEILPDGDKEKQMMQGLLNLRDQLEEAGRQLKLF